MAHVLIGWELGGSRGHALRVVQIADVLRLRGHRISFALQRIDALTPDEARGSAVWQAPLTPRLLANTARPHSRPPHSMGDILARLGCGEPAIVAAIVGAWRQLFAAIQPDLVIAEFAPFLLLAARGRVRTLGAGNGFDAPPATMPRFPSLTGQPSSFDEAETLAGVNAALRAVSIAPISALPEMFHADRQLAATFGEIDPYAEWRTLPLVKPSVSDPEPPIAPGGGGEVFVYAHDRLPIDAPLWKGLAAAKLPVRVVIAGLSEAYRESVRSLGLTLEPSFLPFAEIAARSRLLVSHGGHGFVCSGLLAGLPQVACHYDLEKAGQARAIARLGVGGFVPLASIDPAAFAASLNALYRDNAIFQRAQAVAPGFRARHNQSMQHSVADAAEALL